MPRFPLAAPLLALCLALPAPALAQKAADKKDAPDDVQAAIQRAVEKAKAEIRDEMRAELQGQQSAREFLDAGNGADKPRLELFQLDGYLRVRGDLLNDLSLRRRNDHSLGTDAGYYLFPPPLHDPLGQSTQTSGNLRLRLEPVINVSEQVRILAQIDLLDGIVLGSGRSAENAKDQPWYASSVQAPLAGSNGIDRDSLTVKRVWGEVQTPVGLLSFGRMPSQWGLGIVANAGAGLDDDLGDTVDRLQLAIPLRQTMVGPLVLVPYYDITGSGLVSQNLGGTGQPFSLDKADEAWTLGLKAVRIDTEEELARKLARGESSWNYGALYGYSVQRYALFARPGVVPGDPASTAAVDAINTGYAAHRLSLWSRYRTKRLRLEVEVAGVYGSIADPRTNAVDASPGAVDIRSFGGALQSDYRPRDGKWLLGLELGFASGDRAPGLGNHPERPNTAGVATPIDGPQFGSGSDLAIRNFRFNPAYRVDQILWRELLGNVTDAWYLKPSVRWDVLEGLSLQLAVVYSQAVFSSSTPSGRARPLGLEADTTIRYASDDGFHAWFTWAVLEPLSGLNYPADYGVADLPGLKRAHALRTGLAIKF